MNVRKKLQSPPSYKLQSGVDKKKIYTVPEFYGFENTSTKWMLATLSSRGGLQRLSLLGKEQPQILSSYYQIPDRPNVVSGKLSSSSEQPAFDHLSILYVTPLALAIYLKQMDAVKMLLRYRDFKSRRLVHPNAPCFVQKLFKKGDFKLSNDLSNTYPCIIAIRRRFFEAIPVLMEAGYSPQKEFSIIYRRAFREVVTYYRDIVDYVVDLLRTKPGLHIYNLMNVITNTVCGTTYDLFTFDLEDKDSEGKGKSNQWVSVFRRIARLGVNSRYYNEESGMALITVLEFVQRAGFFRGNLSNLTMPLKQHDDKETKNNTSPIKKMTRSEVLNQPENVREEQIQYDRNMCVGILVYWYQIVVIKRRPVQKERVEQLLARVLIDTSLIELLFDNDDDELADHFSTWSEGAMIRSETVGCLKVHIPEKISTSPSLIQSFTNRYHGIPTDFIHSKTEKTHDDAEAAYLGANNGNIKSYKVDYADNNFNINNHSKIYDEQIEKSDNMSCCVTKTNYSSADRKMMKSSAQSFMGEEHNDLNIQYLDSSINNKSSVGENLPKKQLITGPKTPKRRANVRYMSYGSGRLQRHGSISRLCNEFSTKKSHDKRFQKAQGSKKLTTCFDQIMYHCMNQPNNGGPVPANKRYSNMKYKQELSPVNSSNEDIAINDCDRAAVTANSQTIMNNLMAHLESNLRKSEENLPNRKKK